MLVELLVLDVEVEDVEVLDVLLLVELVDVELVLVLVVTPSRGSSSLRDNLYTRPVTPAEVLDKLTWLIDRKSVV